MTEAPFTSRFYTSPDGLKLHYRDYPGPSNAPFAVLCIPGLTRNARDFEELAPHLAAKYRVLCVELRGRGLSEYAKDPMTYVPPVYVRDVAALIKAASLSQVALIGTSLGGIISMVLAGVMPAKLLGVVLNDIGPEIDPAGLARIAGYLGKTKPVTTWDEAAAAVQITKPVFNARLFMVVSCGPGPSFQRVRPCETRHWNVSILALAVGGGCRARRRTHSGPP